MLGPVGIRRLLMAIAIVAYAFSLLSGYGFLVIALGFDCVMAFLFLFYPKLSDLSADLPDGEPSSAKPVVSAADEVIFAIAVGLAYFLWPQVFGLPEALVPFIVATVIATAMVTIGALAPLLPYDRYARSRPLWTVANEETWFVTNRLVGYGSCPLAIAYIACYPVFPSLWLLTPIVLGCWLGIPALLSWMYYRAHAADAER